MPAPPTCKTCGVELDPNGPHRFTNDAPTAGATKITEQYCDEHCPRCST
jgi:hypothetical protein